MMCYDNFCVSFVLHIDADEDDRQSQSFFFGGEAKESGEGLF